MSAGGQIRRDRLRGCTELAGVVCIQGSKLCLRMPGLILDAYHQRFPWQEARACEAQRYIGRQVRSLELQGSAQGACRDMCGGGRGPLMVTGHALAQGCRLPRYSCQQGREPFGNQSKDAQEEQQRHQPHDRGHHASSRKPARWPSRAVGSR